MRKLLALLCLAFALNACGTAPTAPPGVKVGKPYMVGGETYYPEYDPHYDKTGMASWYGPGFHGGKTANGERFDQDDLTAASPTLPMPCIVRVTNLATGESAIVRINDRGPFKDHRLIDLSRASARTLGIKGLQKVRVEYLKEETETYWAKMNLNTSDITFAKNDPYAPKAQAVQEAAAEENDSVVKSSAPVTYVSATDLKPEDLKIRPIQPQFRVIDDAQAQEAKPAADESHDLNNEYTETKTEADTPSQPQVVRLVDKNGDNVEQEDAPVRPHIVHVQQQLASADPPPAMEKPAPAPLADPPSGKWFIQAGAFSSAENAQKLADSLKNVANVDVAPIDVGGQTLHRVRVGPFTDEDTAEKALDKAISEGAAGARVVQQD